MRRSPHSRAAWALAALLAACGGDDADATTDTGEDTTDDSTLVSSTVDTVDTGVVDPCAEVPITTWENFGAGFVAQNCQACHASSSSERNGAPDDVTFDDEGEALEWSARILSRVVDLQDMPPQGGLTDDDRELVTYWLECGD